jgi:hypothetical protein
MKNDRFTRYFASKVLQNVLKNNLINHTLSWSTLLDQTLPTVLVHKYQGLYHTFTFA